MLIVLLAVVFRDPSISLTDFRLYTTRCAESSSPASRSHPDYFRDSSAFREWRHQVV